jgi:replication factor A1
VLDSGASLDVVLWGERATAFPAEQVHRDGKTTPQTVIFVGALVKSYAGRTLLYYYYAFSGDIN